MMKMRINKIILLLAFFCITAFAGAVSNELDNYLADYFSILKESKNIDTEIDQLMFKAFSNPDLRNDEDWVDSIDSVIDKIISKNQNLLKIPIPKGFAKAGILITKHSVYEVQFYSLRKLLSRSFNRKSNYDRIMFQLKTLNSKLGVLKLQIMRILLAEVGQDKLLDYLLNRNTKKNEIIGQDITALKLFQSFISACNNKSSKSIEDIFSEYPKKMTYKKENLSEYFQNKKEFILNALEIDFFSKKIIKGTVIYSYKVTDSKQVGATVVIQLDKFVLIKIKGGWFIADLKSIADQFKGIDYFDEVFHLEDKSYKKYKKKDLNSVNINDLYTNLAKRVELSEYSKYTLKIVEYRIKKPRIRGMKTHSLFAV